MNYQWKMLDKLMDYQKESMDNLMVTIGANPRKIYEELLVENYQYFHVPSVGTLGQIQKGQSVKPLAVVHECEKKFIRRKKTVEG